MRILWLTIDRSERVADIFGPLQREVSKRSDVDVEFISRADWNRRTIMGQERNRAIIDPEMANRFDVLFTDAPFAYMEEEWASIKIPKALLMEDQHGPLVNRYVGAAFDVFGFSIFFVRYRDATERLWKRLYDRRVFWLPHSIDPATFKDYNLERPIGLLSVGRCQASVYPVRAQVLAECFGEPFFYHVERPQEGDGPKWPTGKDYARLLNRAKMVASCTSIFGYPILKTIEIPACGAVLYSTIEPEMLDMGFRPGENCFKIPDGNIAQSARQSLERDDLSEIAKRGQRLIHKQHTAKVRGQEFVDNLREAT